MKNGMLAVGLLLVCALPSAAVSVAERPALRDFIQEMAAEHGFKSADLTALFGQAMLLTSIIEAITQPAESKPWYEYRPIFVNPARIEGGVEFWKAHEDILSRAARVYGVPPEIIVAIIGVESRYGQNTGSYRVLDALATLGFDYPKRSAFFLGELRDYLLLTREEKIDPVLPKGSYAGAMGVPQFIPSSYRRYAVDFDQDGRRDLWNDPADIIGSVANYFAEHGWQAGAKIALPAEVSGDKYVELLDPGQKPALSLRRLREYGVRFTKDIPDTALGALLDFETGAGMEYWVGLENFYVITRYNHSPLYAMAAYQLSQAIRERYQGSSQ